MTESLFNYLCPVDYTEEDSLDIESLKEWEKLRYKVTQEWVEGDK